MKMIENTLEKLDNYFEDKSDSHFYMVIIMIIAVVGYISYAVLIPMTEKPLKRDLKTKASLESQIKGHKAYLAKITVNGDKRYKIKQLQAEIKREKENLKQLQQLNQYFDIQIQSLSELLFNDKNWARFLDSIAKKGKKHHIHITEISNEFIENQKSFGHVLEIGIKCEGKYRDMLAFMNAIEESELVVDIYQVKLESDTKIQGELKVSVWGINY